MPVGLEIERRFLIERPDVSLLCARYGAVMKMIRQTYLLTPPGYSSERVRMTLCDGISVYTHTKKRRISKESAIEEEEIIGESAYRELLLRADPKRGMIEKSRLTFSIDSQCYEIDFYPFFRRVAILETELSSPDVSLKLPQEIKVIREITGISALSNHALALSVPSEDSLFE